jgi:uncharacterized protein (TIGR02271 family)
MNELTLERLDEMRGAPVYDSAGEKIGEVEEIFYDTETNRPEWIGIGTGLFGTKRILVPVSGSTFEGDAVTVPYGKDQVKDAPDIDDDEISGSREQELYSFYGLGSARTDVRSDRSDVDSEQALTRSEEELHVGKEQRPAGRARLRKWVETEPVELDVELKRETARVVREPIDERVSDRELGEEEVDVTLREERPVVEKQTVAKERVGLQTEVETEHRTVRDEVRKERVDVDEDIDRS